MTPADTASLKQTLKSGAQHEVWERAFRAPRCEQFYEQVFDWLAAHAGLSSGATVLDIGCGIGAHSVRLAQHGFNVVAADFSPDRVAAAKSYVQAQGMGKQIQVQEEDLQTGLSFPSQSFDGVLCWGVLMHIHQNERAMSELVRVTREKGTIILAEANLFSFDGAASWGMGWAKRMLGSKQRKSIGWTRYGMEYLTSTPYGDLMVRHSRIPALIRYFKGQGCSLRYRVSGQFTEAFTRLSQAPFAAAIHAFNSAWFSALKWPRPSFGNVLVFRRDHVES